jgi:hypothetical protein
MKGENSKKRSRKLFLNVMIHLPCSNMYVSLYPQALVLICVFFYVMSIALARLVGLLYLQCLPWLLHYRARYLEGRKGKVTSNVEKGEMSTRRFDWNILFPSVISIHSDFYHHRIHQVLYRAFKPSDPYVKL